MNRPMTEILKAADDPVPSWKSNGQSPPTGPAAIIAPPTITLEEAAEKLLAVVDHIRTATATKISNAKIQLDNLEKELDLHSVSTQGGLRDLFKLVGSIETELGNVQVTIKEITEKHLQS